MQEVAYNRQRCHVMLYEQFAVRVSTIQHIYRQDATKRQTAGIKFTHKPKIRFFDPPRRSDSLHRFT